MIKVFLWSIVLITSTFLFKKCAGTLNPCKLNILSFAYFIILLQTVIGAIFTSFGYTGHYTYSLLNYAEKYSQMGSLWAAALIVLLPAVSCVIFKLSKIKPEIEYHNYLQAETKTENDKTFFLLIIFASIFCLIMLVIMLFDIGYIPLLKLFFHEESFNFSLERQTNEDIVILGSQYIKSIFVMYAIPVLSYIAFGFFLETRKTHWTILFALLFFASIVVKTYNFAKAPIVLYFVVLVLIYIIFSGGISFKLLIGFGIIGVALLVIGYQALGFSASYLDIYNGILGRTLFTQFGTLCLHFEAFSEYFQFLSGRSLYPTFLSILGINPDLHIRSARVVMELYKPEGVYSGEAGVMNTVFVGEAYANWGVPGILFSILWVGIILTACFILFMKMKKNAITIAYYGIITQQLAMGLEGGFTDYIYNSTILLNFLGLFFLYFFPMMIEKIKGTYSKRIKHTDYRK